MAADRARRRVASFPQAASLQPCRESRWHLLPVSRFAPYALNDPFVAENSDLRSAVAQALQDLIGVRTGLGQG